jgi:hypothetical protein
MPWVTLKTPQELTTREIADNGRIYEIKWLNGRAYVPLHLHNYLIREGKAVHVDEPDPKVRFESLGKVNGAPISPFSNYVREVES